MVVADVVDVLDPEVAADGVLRLDIPVVSVLYHVVEVAIELVPYPVVSVIKIYIVCICIW